MPTIFLDYLSKLSTLSPVSKDKSRQVKQPPAPQGENPAPPDPVREEILQEILKRNPALTRQEAEEELDEFY